MKVVRIIAPPFLTASKSSELQGKLLICSNYAVWDLGLRQNHWVTHITFVDFNLDKVTSYSQLIHALPYFMNIMNLLINSWKVYDFLDPAAPPVSSDDLTSDCIGGSQGRDICLQLGLVLYGRKALWSTGWLGGFFLPGNWYFCLLTELHLAGSHHVLHIFYYLLFR